MVLSGVSVDINWVGNIQGAGPGEGEPLDNSEGTRFGNKQGIYYVEVPCRSRVEFLWVEFGTFVVPCDGRAAGIGIEKLQG